MLGLPTQRRRRRRRWGQATDDVPDDDLADDDTDQGDHSAGDIEYAEIEDGDHDQTDHAINGDHVANGDQPATRHDRFAVTDLPLTTWNSSRCWVAQPGSVSSGFDRRWAVRARQHQIDRVRTRGW